uniref:Uncharacterized protein n=1 Tax=Arundo donax TaxID=35708 RepID=A0A0A9H998_ARUDO
MTGSSTADSRKNVLVCDIHKVHAGSFMILCFFIQHYIEKCN